MSAPSPEFFALQPAVAGRYSLEREIGRGGMGVVFLARDVALDRPVAIKLLPPTLAAQPAARERFVREARVAARLSHPNIVPIHAVEETDDLAWYVMTFVDGETLGERVRRAGPLPARDAMRVTQEVAWALAHAHAHGVVHRDVKPDNVLLERGSGRALVTDFGIARAVEGTTPIDGTAIGTPAYMSPEQAAGERADTRSDLYSLGATAFYAASGRLPFEAPNALAMLARHAAAPAPPLLAARPSLPPAFTRAVDRCLAKSPAERWESAEALAAALGASRGDVPEVPAPVRAFLRDVGGAGSEIGNALLASLVAATAAVLEDPGLFGISLIVLMVCTMLTACIALARLAQVGLRARTLLAAGYGHGAVRPALALETRAAQEEGDGADASRARVPFGWIALGVAATAFCYWLTTLDLLALGTLGGGGGIVAATATLRLVWNAWMRRPGGLWRRLLAGRFGSALFRVAGIGLRGAAPAVPVGGEPTVLALGRAAEELFVALPADARARLGDVPALLARLQADALALKARGEPAADERHATAVAALEAVRLDLLRLHGGGGSLDELTRDVEAARAIGARIDAELASREAMRRLADAATPA
ncbi:protein kinase [Gemmatirosa kalamazoonensis]|uniref:non-specific serine/threonine protein kinase n=1 Tax=Gemmatirosa kalamazoonensis TaxID=861299 RepID=W0RH26_9BACT|nr:serine/threonine-protein kinase [Gemmatirosa kalamazoonensis]AHG89707.1 protein kinase [Gemmatirosa kalamazoonensis]